MKFIISLLLSFIMFLTLTGCHNKQADQENSESNPTSSLDNAFNNIEIYQDVLTDYKKIVDFRLSDDFETIWNEQTLPDIPTLSAGFNSVVDEHWSNMLVEMYHIDEGLNSNDYDYFFSDINNDGVPELFWTKKSNEILAAFTYNEEKVVLLDAFWSRYKANITEEKELLIFAYSGASDISFSLYSLNSMGKLDRKTEFGMEFDSSANAEKYYEIDNGKKTNITKKRFDELTLKYPFNK